MLLSTFKCFSQNDTVFIKANQNPFSENAEYKIDTVIFRFPSSRNVLIGNAILTQTFNQQIAKGFGFFLEDFKVKNCHQNEKPQPSKIIGIEKEKGEWRIKALVYTNCCQDFLADISIEDDNTLNLIFHNYGTYCSCSCPFEITYKLRVMEFDRLKKIEFLEINGEAKTPIKK